MPEIFETEIVVKVKVKHWGTMNPQDVIRSVQSNINVPNVTESTVISGQTNWRIHKPPMRQPVEFDLSEPFSLDTWSDK